MKRIFSLMTAIAVIVFSIDGTYAADYTFKAKDTNDFYRYTPYEVVYGSAYN